MKRSLLSGACAWLMASAVFAAAAPREVAGSGDLLSGRIASPSPAKQDTMYLLGGPGAVDGRFQVGGSVHSGGQPQWHGWTSVDLTFEPDHRWSVTDDVWCAAAGSKALWVGVYQPPTWSNPGAPGYGNNWLETVVYSRVVADPGQPANVRIGFKICHDTEEDYDVVHVEYNTPAGWHGLATFSGRSGPALWDSGVVTYPANAYVGAQGDEIQLRIRFASDGYYSDEDGFWPTAHGAAQFDDIAVYIDGQLVSFEDFENMPIGQPGQEMVFGSWRVDVAPGVGDFAALWSNLADLDPCRTNSSPQVAFIDDGRVVPGTGGTPGQTWTYGPGGYILNNTGGLMGPDHHLNNVVVSPPVAVPAPLDGVTFGFDVYLHEQLGPDSPGMFFYWQVRSTSSGDPQDLATAAWRDFNFLYLPPSPQYYRYRYDVASLLEPGRTHMQVRLGVRQLGWVWGYNGTDGTPAPYFDNVSIAAYAYQGPTITANPVDLAQDDFPASGDLDFADLGANAIRFDMARNISPAAHGLNTPGDTLVADVAVVRDGYALHGPPRLFFAMRANPLFDGVRDLSDPSLVDLQVAGEVITGCVAGLPTYNAQGVLVANRWNFDLPDDGFFFPGDIIHYYIEAQDILGDDPGTIGVARLPADLTGFGDLASSMVYSTTFTVRGLPTLFSPQPGDQPPILWWNHSDTRGGEDEWLYALANIGCRPGVDYDMYYTNAPLARAGNGLGGRATGAQLAGYQVLLLTTGDLPPAYGLGIGSATNLSDDVGLLNAWFAQGGKGAFLTGDNLVSGLQFTGGAAAALLSDYLGVVWLTSILRPTIDNQVAPLVRPVAGNGLIADGRAWHAYGGCPTLNMFDGVVPVARAERLAYYTSPAGQGDPYAYAAAVRHYNETHDATVVSLPYDFMSVWSAGEGGKSIAVRALLLQDILQAFGAGGGSDPSHAAPAAVLAVGSFPNPFNPATTIRLHLPRAGLVGLKIFNVRGELVRILADDRFEPGVHDLAWDGTTARGAAAAAGIYFYEVKADGETKVGRMALIR